MKAYYDYMVDIAVLFGANRQRATQELLESLKFEIKLANVRGNIIFIFKRLFHSTVHSADIVTERGKA